MPDDATGMSTTTDTGASGAPSNPAAPSSDPGGGGGAGIQAGAPAAARPDYLLEGYNSAEEQARAFHQQHGSIQEMQALSEWYQQNYDDLQQWYQQRGMQQQQPQQPQLPKNLAWMEHAKNPQIAAAYQAAMASGGQLPENWQGRDEAMQRLQEVQQFWDQAYLNPEQMMLDLFQLPGVKQAIQQMSGQVVQPIQQQVHQQHVNNLLQTYGPQLQKMHPATQEIFMEGGFGTGEAAAKKALAYNAKHFGGQQQQQQPTQTPPTKEPEKNGAHANGKPAASNGQQRSKREQTEAESREYARTAAKARIALQKERS
jgi:hypothetical protein